ncbi:MAG: ATP-binding cassette domain-containing protein [Candidatus Omnitrophica bacterium]|nr:ATP-binding cassette domain-containing protein [Candidatus Omnitrophota bacterium]
MIQVAGLTKAFGGSKVLDGVSFAVPPGELVALMGLSGTGKSVLLLHIIGLLTPDAGTITVDGEHITELSERKLLAFRRKVGYLFQDGALYDFMTVGENLAFPLKEHTRLKAADIRAKSAAYLKMVDLDGAADKYPSELSGGMRKRAALARALITDVKVLLCDEPTSGLDPIRSRDISLLIRELSKKAGCATVVATHDIVNAFRIADRAFVLDRGRFAAQGTEQEVRGSADPFVKEFLAG